MISLARPAPLRPTSGAGYGPVPERIARFESLYQDYVGFVFRALRHLGVEAGSLDDAVQDVFVVVHRRLDQLEEDSLSRSWLYSIVVRVARNHRRSFFRRTLRWFTVPASDPDALGDVRAVLPETAAAQAEALVLLQRLLDRLAPARRLVFVLAELEGLTAREIAEITGAPVNTVSSRLRLARRDFERVLARERARDGGAT